MALLGVSLPLIGMELSVFCLPCIVDRDQGKTGCGGSFKLFGSLGRKGKSESREHHVDLPFGVKGYIRLSLRVLWPKAGMTTAFGIALV